MSVVGSIHVASATRCYSQLCAMRAPKLPAGRTWLKRHSSRCWRPGRRQPVRSSTSRGLAAPWSSVTMPRTGFPGAWAASASASTTSRRTSPGIRGAAEVARRLAEHLEAPLVLSGYSRLVVDCNRPGLPDRCSGERRYDRSRQSLSLPRVERRASRRSCPYHAPSPRCSIGVPPPGVLACAQAIVSRRY